MNIELSFQSSGISTYTQGDKELNKDTKMSGKEITNAYLVEYQLKISSNSQDNFTKQVDTFSLADIGYSGKAIGDLSQDEAKALVSEDGFFGISQTSARIADFVLNGAGDDVEKLKAGRSGMLQGFKEAEALWGEKLPEISYTTMQKALEKVDAKLNALGVNVLDSLA
ncbi:MAG: hydrogenase-4 component G [Sulfurospirillaceae bacterium]|nr:hydrogenase-4 component G [Sulfurospirillaceae bacterium]MDD2825817.1 hydrogenase-4 component G [Sulfurospirillaceae bacterium]